MKIKIALAILLAFGTAKAEQVVRRVPALTGVVHKFELWRSAKRTVEKLFLYWGWTNGFLQGGDESVMALGVCLDAISDLQTAAIIDRYFQAHPEKWALPLGDQILEAMTVAGGPCEGKNPLRR